ncbi:MAG: S1 family peptidase [Bifidobacteriaceae bacterium]|jgi:hypothetical protein|nr:S1 family peptidase [Bifidobacteriaceae bacterium]
MARVRRKPLTCTVVLFAATILIAPLGISHPVVAVADDDVTLTSQSIELPPPPELPEGEGVSPLEFAGAVREQALEQLGDRYVEMWMAPAQDHFVIGVLDLAADEAAALEESLGEIVEVEVVERHVARADVDALADSVMQALTESGVQWSEIDRHYERGFVGVAAPTSTDLDAIASLLEPITSEAPLRGQAALDVNRMLNFEAALDSPRVALTLAPLSEGTGGSRDDLPLQGGKRIKIGTTAYQCSFGFAVSGDGGEYGLTAGHCGFVGETVRTGNLAVLTNLMNNTFWGATNVDSDAVLFHLPSSAWWETTVYYGTDTARPVVAQAGAYYSTDLAVPYGWVCFNGASSGAESCGYISSTATSVGYTADRAANTSVITTLDDAIKVYWNSTSPGAKKGDSGGGLYGVNPDASAIALGLSACCQLNPNDSTNQCLQSGAAYFTKISKALTRTGTVLMAQGRQPFGSLDTASGGAGTVSVSGWVIDPDLARSATWAYIYIGGPMGSGAPLWAVPANQIRTDVEAAYANTGKYHGFAATLITSIRGTNIPVYAYGADIGGSFSGHKQLWATPKYVTIN